jgi:hypothetical protein
MQNNCDFYRNPAISRPCQCDDEDEPCTFDRRRVNGQVAGSSARGTVFYPVVASGTYDVEVRSRRTLPELGSKPIKSVSHRGCFCPDSRHWPGRVSSSGKCHQLAWEISEREPPRSRWSTTSIESRSANLPCLSPAERTVSHTSAYRWQYAATPSRLPRFASPCFQWLAPAPLPSRTPLRRRPIRCCSRRDS